MKLRNFILVSSMLFTNFVYSQNCDCKSNFEWVKKTFEENDAGFDHALRAKGITSYQEHNKKYSDKAIDIQTISECTAFLYSWLQFFRSGHIAIRPLETNIQTNPNIQLPQTNKPISENQFSNWEKYEISIDEFMRYLDNEKISEYEGIWETSPYKIGIKKDGNKYFGFIIESGASTWSPGQIKLKFEINDGDANSIFYMRDHSGVESKSVSMLGKNHLQIGIFNLSRIYPKLVDDPKFVQYFNSLNAEFPFIEELNSTTIYFRIPSFDHSYKGIIDSVITANKAKILSTKNLIIDIRNNGGGSDNSYSEIIPFLYTNPIRGIGVEFLSTKLNNQRMLDFINNPEYEIDEDGKKWAKNGYDKLESKLGQFVNLSNNIFSEDIRDTIYPFPKNVGIIINKGNGSTAEQFLLEAKQSLKVKLFGETTLGVLDISNMYFVDSPCKEFQLGYSLSRSMRIPDFTIDDKGIQPDFYIDKSIPYYDWTNYVNKILIGQ
jgi:hypothetical protein